MKKLSDSLQELALSGFEKPDSLQTEEDLAIALFYAQVAWNTANGEQIPQETISMISEQMAIPKLLPSSFTHRSSQNAIKAMTSYKRKNMPKDDRVVLAVLFEDDRIKVHWREANVFS